MKPPRAACYLFLLTGCNVFDAQLYLQRDAGPDGMGLPPLALADRCSAGVPLVTRTTGEYAIDTRTLGNDLNDLASCAGRALPGNDGFFRVAMTAGDLWHFHVKALDGASNPALYVLPGCDERACVTGLDECGNGRDEHLSFRARESRDYIIGIDSARAAGARHEITIVRATCGDGTAEHGESCDDRNRTPGDGCDALCRAELRDGSMEREPNDDFSDPNMIIPPAASGSVTVQGRLGGRCDFDMYGVELPVGGSVRATMLDINGRPCEMGSPEFNMAWVLPDGRTASGAGVVTMGNRCPAITESEGFAQRVTAAGIYHVRVSTVADLPAAVDYKIRFEVTRP